MKKQAYIYVHRKQMPEPSKELYTASTRRVTLQGSNEFRFEGKSCGTWACTGDGLLIAQFRAGGIGGHLNHIFMKTATKDCWRLVTATDPMYTCIAGETHNNADSEIVLLIKIPEDIAYADGDGE